MHALTQLFESAGLSLSRVAVVLLSVLVAPATTRAQSYGIEDLELSKVPGVLKFQARISQAKLPIEDADVPEVEVKLQTDTATLCSQTFNNVRVRNSVLNLEIGPVLDTCTLDQVIADNDQLYLQACIGGGCLQPIPLGTVPYSFKSDYAVRTQYAYRSDRAAQSEFAHHVSADASMLETNAIGYGYFDFHTPVDGGTCYDPSLTGIDATGAAYDYSAGGFLQWVPVQEIAPTLNICSADQLGQIAPLAEVVLHSAETIVRGDMRVVNNSHVFGSDVVEGSLTVNSGETITAGGLTVTGSTVTNNGLTVVDDGSLADDLWCEGGARFDKNARFGDPAAPGTWGLDVHSAATFDGSVTVADGTAADDLWSVGHARFDGAVTIADSAAADDLWCAGHANFAGSVVLGGGVEVVNSAAATDLVCQGEAVFNNHARFNANAQFGATPDDTTLEVYSSVNFHGAVALDEPWSGTAGPNSVDSAAIQDGAVGSVDLASDAVTSDKIADGAVIGTDIADGSIQAIHLDNAQLRGLLAELAASSWLLAASRSTLHEINYGRNHGYWVAVGESGGIQTSAEAVRWENRDSGSSELLVSVVEHLDGWMAVGNNGTILESEDAVTWSAATPVTSSHLRDVTSVHSSVGLPTSRAVAVGHDGTIIYTNLGAGIGGTWNVATSGTTAMLWGVACVGAGVASVAVGELGTIVTSTDFATWTPQSSPTSEFLRDVAIGAGTYVAVGDSGTILSSTSPTTAWVQVDSGTTLDLSGVAYDHVGQWTVVGAGGLVLTSQDSGVTWTSRDSGASGSLKSVAQDGAGRWAAIEFGAGIRFTSIRWR